MTKRTFYVFVNDPEQAMEGDFFLSLRITDDRGKDFHERHDYPFVQSVEIDMDNVNREDITLKAVDAIDNQIKERRAVLQQEINRLEERKASLLAITHQPGN